MDAPDASSTCFFCAMACSASCAMPSRSRSTARTCSSFSWRSAWRRLTSTRRLWPISVASSMSLVRCCAVLRARRDDEASRAGVVDEADAIEAFEVDAARSAIEGRLLSDRLGARGRTGAPECGSARAAASLRVGTPRAAAVPTTWYRSWLPFSHRSSSSSSARRLFLVSSPTSRASLSSLLSPPPPPPPVLRAADELDDDWRSANRVATSAMSRMRPSSSCCCERRAWPSWPASWTSSALARRSDSRRFRRDDWVRWASSLLVSAPARCGGRDDMRDEVRGEPEWYGSSVRNEWIEADGEAGGSPFRVVMLAVVAVLREGVRSSSVRSSPERGSRTGTSARASAAC